MSMHNPYANAYPVGGRPWSPEDDRIVAEMKSAGHSHPEIAERVNRTALAVTGRLQYLKTSPEEKTRRLQRRRDREHARSIGQFENPQKSDPPPHVIEDRNRRLSVPRTLTAILMGDPVR